MYNDNNKNRHFRNVADISKTVEGKVEGYVLNVTNDKSDIENSIKNENEKSISLSIKKKNNEKLFKIVNDNFIYNI